MCEIISKNPMFLLNDNTKKESLISPRANINGAITYQFFKGKEEIPVNISRTGRNCLEGREERVFHEPPRVVRVRGGDEW